MLGAAPLTRAAASPRVRTPSLRRTAETSWSTVLTERKSRAAMSALRRPSASRTRRHCAGVERPPQARRWTTVRSRVDETPILDCRGLRKRFGERIAVDGVSLRVAPGETYGL